MRLYYSPMSSNSRRVRMAAFELGTSLELELVDLKKGEQKRPEYLRLNPNGRVPVLDDDGFVLYESHAIMQYLSEGSDALYPRDPRARADVNRWLFWISIHFVPAVGRISFERMVKQLRGLGDPDPAELARAEQLVRDASAVLDAHLGKQPFLAQERLTLADLSLAASLTLAHLLPELGQNTTRWLEQMKTRASWKQTTPGT